MFIINRKSVDNLRINSRLGTAEDEPEEPKKLQFNISPKMAFHVLKMKFCKKKKK